MPEKLVWISGLSRDEYSYHRLQAETPPGWEVFPIPLVQLLRARDFSDIEQNIADFIGDQGLCQVSIGGHSLGGGFALRFAAHAPDMVKKLFLVDSIGVPGRSITQSVRGALRPNIQDKSRLLEDLVAYARVLKRPFLNARLAKYAFSADLREQAGNIKIPTKVFHADEDILIPISKGRELAEVIPSSEFVSIAGGHDWILRSPQFFWENIK